MRERDGGQQNHFSAILLGNTLLEGSEAERSCGLWNPRVHLSENMFFFLFPPTHTLFPKQNTN